MSEQSLTDYELRILDNVATSGCHITSIFDPDGEEVTFAYSAGFVKTASQPEIICFGLSTDVMGFMINETLAQCLGGLELTEDVRISGLLDGHDVVAKLIPQYRIEREYFNSAMWFHEHEFETELTQAMQLIWPDSCNGLFPWEVGCARDVIDLQPALYQPRLNS
jgi:Domain of unknown function (DUF4262)